MKKVSDLNLYVNIGYVDRKKNWSLDFVLIIFIQFTLTNTTRYYLEMKLIH